MLTEGAPIESFALVGDHALTKTAGALASWDLATGRRDELFSWARDPHGLGVGVPSPDGTQLLIPGADYSMEVRRRDAAPLVLRGHHAQITHVEWSRDYATLYLVVGGWLAAPLGARDRHLDGTDRRDVTRARVRGRRRWPHRRRGR